MTKRQWHSGPPPSVGWWPASVCEDPEAIRWWDGVWSLMAVPENDAETAAWLAGQPADQDQIKWTERWWE